MIYANRFSDLRPREDSFSNSELRRLFVACGFFIKEFGEDTDSKFSAYLDFYISIIGSREPDDIFIVDDDTIKFYLEVNVHSEDGCLCHSDRNYLDERFLNYHNISSFDPYTMTSAVIGALEEYLYFRDNHAGFYDPDIREIRFIPPRSGTRNGKNFI